ncbi:hypothetical protein E2C01_062458 [Portunus trituberculatus]|uniref:Uncharacterized protein n=1 Tax=Portunus trituberculatus TaxID=210409 RepID=A0A5B7H7X7_PORTR|nr:hypothetical protein [Portunus trituberculatus]
MEVPAALTAGQTDDPSAGIFASTPCTPAHSRNVSVRCVLVPHSTQTLKRHYEYTLYSHPRSPQRFQICLFHRIPGFPDYSASSFQRHRHTRKNIAFCHIPLPSPNPHLQ